MGKLNRTLAPEELDLVAYSLAIAVLQVVKGVEPTTLSRLLELLGEGEDAIAG